MTGYLHPGYARALSEFGNPRELPRCGGWILERQIPGYDDWDAMGCYPLFACHHWKRLGRDLVELNGNLVSIALVTDPFGNYSISDLQEAFDSVRPFKKHLVADLSVPLEEIVSQHHRYYANRALRQVSVEFCEEPERYLDDWVMLYGHLIRRHHIQGLRAFSRESFKHQFQIPGFKLFRAVYQGETIGARCYYVQNSVAYAHLSAMNEIGYRLRAAYAIDLVSMEYFKKHLKWIDHGAGAGLDDSDQNGLHHFKSGWANSTRTVFFCTRILNQQRYDEITQKMGIEPNGYFPAYRKGEFS